MPLSYSQWIWGFEIFASGPNQNNRLAFKRDGTDYDGATAASLNAGVYTADELATEVARAMNTATANSDISCSFSYSTQKFTITKSGGGTFFQLYFGPTAASDLVDCNNLLGFSPTLHDGFFTYESDAPVGSFKVLASGIQNNRLAFTRKPDGGSPTTYDGATAATLNAGTYTPDALAAEVQRAMRERTGSTDLFCKFLADPTWRFAISIGDDAVPKGDLSLLFDSAQVGATDCNDLLGFSPTAHNTDNLNNGDTFSSDYSMVVPEIWIGLEPLVYASPVIAQEASANPKYASLLSHRSMRAMQQVSDGGSIETIFISTLKSVQVGFRALLSSEQTKMERFLNWAVMGKRFTWQPDKTSPKLLKLVLANPGQINNQFEWLTRSEIGYGTLTFYEQLNP